MGKDAEVTYSDGADTAAAAELAREADVAMVIIGNHPTCDAGWAKCPLPSDGKEAIDRKTLTLAQEDLAKAVLAANPEDGCGAAGELPVYDDVDAGECARDPDDDARQRGAGRWAGRRALRRLQPGGAPEPDVGRVDGPTAADDGLRHPQRADVHVSQAASRCMRSAMG